MSSPPESPLTFEMEGQVAILTLNRPGRGNAISPDMMLALEEAWGRVNRDDAIRVVIMTGAGERHFCTGADLRVSTIPVNPGPADAPAKVLA